MFLGIFGIIWVIFEIFNLRKAARLVAADFPNLTPELLELKRSKMRKSAWWLLGGAIFLVVIGNLLLVMAAGSDSESGRTAAYAIGGGGFFISLIISGICGSGAAKLK